MTRNDSNNDSVEPGAEPSEPHTGETDAATRDHRAPFGDESASWRGDAEEAGIPDRYDVRRQEQGAALFCREAPGITVFVDRALSFTEAEARKLPPRTILLDGAGAFAPLVDDAALLFNLDHHQGCSRAFTAATCEQALILVFKGLDLDQGEWRIYANEPDLDTVLAIWILLNHRRLRSLSPQARDRIVPLIRVEGAIDANGFEIAELCGLPSDLFLAEKKRLDSLHGMELDVKKSGVWAKTDMTVYTADMLRAVDRMVYRDADFHDYTSVEAEFAHVEIGSGKVAVVCRDGGGIYDVEKRLRKVWGDRLGLIALEKESGQFTLRRSAALAGIELAAAYRKLNLLDPVVDGSPPSKCWGGSDEIGGSPRPDGTGLSPLEIAKILKLTYRRPGLWQRARALMGAALWVAAAMVPAVLVVYLLRFLELSSATAKGWAKETLAASVVVALFAWVVTRQVSRGWSWLYGWRRPSWSRGLLWVVPVVLVAAAAGGLWFPATASAAGLPWAVAAAWGIVVASELLLRGLTHGLLILDHPEQSPDGPWRPSLPSQFVAVVQAGMVTALFVRFPVPPLVEGLLAVEPRWTPWIVFVASFVLGTALGVLRERSRSLWPGLGLLGLVQTLVLLLGARV